MRRFFSDYVETLRARLLGPLGKLPVQMRTGIVEGRIVDGPLNDLVVRVRGNASSITDAHIQALRARGVSEDEIFEAAVCAAFRAGMDRYEAAQHALRQAGNAS